ncbi:hypothetical protein GCM10020000_14650 [Streptomyces olivoverticillatus]
MLAEVDDLPTRTSGKVDRNALPWPLTQTQTGGGEELHGTAARLADLWERLLGIRPGADSDFVLMGGSSLTAARMASALREHHPGVSVAGLYRHTVLRDMAEHLDSLTPPRRAPGRPPRRAVRPVRRRTGAAQLVVQGLLFGITGLRGLVGLAAADNILGLLAPQGLGPPYTSWWLVLTGWFVLFSAPARATIGAVAARLLTHGITPGTYPRGGRAHLRLWAAERTVATFGVPSLLGTPWAAWYARTLGCAAGKGVALHAMPPVTGLAELGDGCSVEPEADIAGWWLDGEHLHVGAVHIGPDARVGHRAMLMPGARLDAGAELAPGACLDGHVPAGQSWEGAPARPAPQPNGVHHPAATSAFDGHLPGHPDTGDLGWPAPRTHRSRRWAAAYALSLFAMPLLPLIAAAPALVGTYVLVKSATTLSAVALLLLAAAPAVTLVSTVCWILVVALTVRILGRGIKPGIHPACGGVAWRAWLVTGLLNSTRGSLFPLYASLATPVWLRLLGARVGKRAEISTVLPLPSLLSVDDGAFLADDTLVAPPTNCAAAGCAWATPTSDGAPSSATPASSAPAAPCPTTGSSGCSPTPPEHSEPGSSWLGRPAMPLPRVATQADSGRTFTPPRRLVLARMAVELCRILPLMCGLVLAEAVFLGEQDALDTGGLGLAALVGAPLLLAAGLAAGLTATAAKWLLMGRFKVSEHPLWSSFVWRNELYDTFVESLAVPWLAAPLHRHPRPQLVAAHPGCAHRPGRVVRHTLASGDGPGHPRRRGQRQPRLRPPDAPLPRQDHADGLRPPRRGRLARPARHRAARHHHRGTHRHRPLLAGHAGRDGPRPDPLDGQPHRGRAPGTRRSGGRARRPGVRARGVRGDAA